MEGCVQLLTTIISFIFKDIAKHGRSYVLGMGGVYQGLGGWAKPPLDDFIRG